VNNTNISQTYDFVILDPPIIIETNSTSTGEGVRISWSYNQFIDYYRVYIKTSYNEQFPLTANATGITDLNWTDENASQDSVRYYKVSAVRGQAEKMSENLIGKLTYQLKNNWNLVSVPFDLSNWTLYNDTHSAYNLSVQPKGAVLSIWKMHNNGTDSCYDEMLFQDDGWYPAQSTCDNWTTHSMQAAQGYWFEVNNGICNNNCNVTFVGAVPLDEMNISLGKGNNMVGWYSGNDSVMLSDYSFRDPFEVTPQESIDSVFRYNPSAEWFESSMYFGGWGWWSMDGFEYLEPGRGYWVYTIQATNWTHTP
jgi:hypothetical protein